MWRFGGEGSAEGCGDGLEELDEGRRQSVDCVGWGGGRLRGWERVEDVGGGSGGGIGKERDWGEVANRCAGRSRCGIRVGCVLDLVRGFASILRGRRGLRRTIKIGIGPRYRKVAVDNLQ
jgi:hypothetical protein